MDALQEIAHVDKTLVKHSVVRFNYTVLNPINREEEFEKFKENKLYNPQFRYNSFDVEYHIEGLENLEIPDNHPLSEVLKEIKDNLLIEAKALKNIGTKEFNVKGIFPKLLPTTVASAKKILAEPKEPLEKKTKDKTAEEFAAKLKEILDHYNCRGWTIKFDKHAGSRASISAATKLITIREGEKFSTTGINRLIKHEIETHVLRAVNGTNQGLEITSIGLPQYLATEEGLAIYNEGQITPITQEKFIRIARQVLVCYYASKVSFAQTFALVRQYYHDDFTCFKSVTRSKRGLADTSNPGGYIKDHCYLQGYLQIKRFIEKGGDIKKLYAGKIGLHHVYLVNEGLFTPATTLPDFLNKNTKL